MCIWRYARLPRPGRPVWQLSLVSRRRFEVCGPRIGSGAVFQQPPAGRQGALFARPGGRGRVPGDDWPSGGGERARARARPAARAPRAPAAAVPAARARSPPPPDGATLILTAAAAPLRGAAPYSSRGRESPRVPVQTPPHGGAGALAAPRRGPGGPAGGPSGLCGPAAARRAAAAVSLSRRGGGRARGARVGEAASRRSPRLDPHAHSIPQVCHARARRAQQPPAGRAGRQLSCARRAPRRTARAAGARPALTARRGAARRVPRPTWGAPGCGERPSVPASGRAHVHKGLLSS